MKLAVIADDFTGGADAASFLKRKKCKSCSSNKNTTQTSRM